MSDDAKPDTTAAVTIVASPAGKLTVSDIRIVPTAARSNANELIDIVEIELAIPNDGNCCWFRWMDCLRFQVERGHADEALKLLGLK
jgi:hypothetical protein